MAIAVVTATLIQNGSGATASASVNATAGNALIVGGAMFNSASWVVTRTGDTYTTDTNGNNASTDGTGIASAPNVAGGAVTCQIACAGGSAISGWAMEVSGLPTSSIRDATSPAVATGTSTTPLSNSVANVTADAIFVGSFGNNAGNTTVTPGGSYSATAGATTMTETQGASLMVGGLEYQIVSTTASRTAGWTTGSSVAWTAGIAVYRAAAGAAGIPPGLGPVAQMTEPNQAANLAAMMR